MSTWFVYQTCAMLNVFNLYGFVQYQSRSYAWHRYWEQHPNDVLCQNYYEIVVPAAKL